MTGDLGGLIHVPPVKRPARDWRPNIGGGWHELGPDVVDRIKARMPARTYVLRVFERLLPNDELLLCFTDQEPIEIQRQVVPQWHLSISHQLIDRETQATRPGRYPTWDEMKDARYRFTPPHVSMCMILPPPEDFVAIHDTCFHLFQHFQPS